MTPSEALSRTLEARRTIAEADAKYLKTWVGDRIRFATCDGRDGFCATVPGLVRYMSPTEKYLWLREQVAAWYGDFKWDVNVDTAGNVYLLTLSWSNA